MSHYTFELTKTITVTVQAKSLEEATQNITLSSQEQDWGASWIGAEPKIKCVDSSGEQQVFFVCNHRPTTTTPCWTFTKDALVAYFGTFCQELDSMETLLVSKVATTDEITEQVEAACLELRRKRGWIV